MNDSAYEQLAAAAARRELTASEKAQLEAWLGLHPETREAWELERRLTLSLQRLADLPVPSNFTAQVLQATQRSIRQRPDSVLTGWLRWVRNRGHGWQLGVAGSALALIVTLQVHQTHQRAELARSLAALPVSGLADVELWRDFEQINALPNGPLPSVDQLAEALK